MTRNANARPFNFDTEFDAQGQVVQSTAWQPVKRSYLPAEVDALVAQARLEGRETALAEVESIQAMAMTSIGQTVAEAAGHLAAIAAAHRQQAAELAVAAARVIAGSALERLPHEALNAALASLGQEIEASPRLLIRANGLNEEARRLIETRCADAGFAGVVAFREEPGLASAAFQLEWADGRADFDPNVSAQRVLEAVASALAAEGGHSEPAPQTSPYGSAF